MSPFDFSEFEQKQGDEGIRLTRTEVHMRLRLLPLLRSPNDPRQPLRAFAYEVRRNAGVAVDLEQGEMSETDEMIHGVLMDQSGSYAYPVSDAIPMLLSDADTDVDSQVSLLGQHRDRAPAVFRTAIQATIERISASASSSEGRWNREEMAYYDNELSTPEGFARLENDYRTKPSWGVLIPRYTYLVKPMCQELEGRWLLEVGCGGARTMSWLKARHAFSGDYVGVDVSRARLTIAKRLMPSGDFVQASALNLPFRDEGFGGVLGFGVYHHLPDPLAGIEDSLKKVAPGGLLGFHEPIDTPKLLTVDSRLRPFVERFLVTYVHSEHDNEIALASTLRLLSASGATLMTARYSHSAVHAVASRIVGLLPQRFRGLRTYRLTSGLDALGVHTICRLSERFGPRAVVLLARRGMA